MFEECRDIGAGSHAVGIEGIQKVVQERGLTLRTVTGSPNVGRCSTDGVDHLDTRIIEDGAAIRKRVGQDLRPSSGQPMAHLRLVIAFMMAMFRASWEWSRSKGR